MNIFLRITSVSAREGQNVQKVPHKSDLEYLHTRNTPTKSNATNMADKIKSTTLGKTIEKPIPRHDKTIPKKDFNTLNIILFFV